MRRYFTIALFITAFCTIHAQAYRPDEQDLEWKRNVYTRIDKKDEHNTGLFFLADGNNAFTPLFHLIVDGMLQAYDYTLDGMAHLDRQHLSDLPALLDNFGIAYSKDADGRLSVADAGIPAEDVQAWLIVVSEKYNRHNSDFYKTVTAICPVLTTTDESEELVNYPLCWIDFEKARPFLNQLQTIADGRNMANIISVEDFFDMNLFAGDIYKVDRQNIQDDSKTVIQEEIYNVKKNIYKVRKK